MYFEVLLASSVQFSYQKDLEKIGLVIFHALGKKKSSASVKAAVNSLRSSRLTARLALATAPERLFSIVQLGAVPSSLLFNPFPSFCTQSSSYLPKVWSM